MIELRTLGTLILRDANGEDVTSVLAQPKRVALLAYLAIARPRGFHRRDTLLARLWPEQDERHGRWALNQALRHLRTALGKEVVSSRGDGEVGIDARHLTCDAVDFDAAIEAGDPARALALYRGDLLDGFHVTGCGDFERWLEEERVWLRRRAARAAAALARQEEARGEPAAAIHRARQALALAPDDEGEARRLIELLGRVGDRAGAIQAYEDFARRLRDEYEAEPAPETRAAIAAVRARQSRDPSTAPRFDESQEEQKETGVDTTVAPGARRRKLPLVLGVSLLAAIGAAVWSGRVPARPEAISSRANLAVLPFLYRGSPELAYLADGMVDLLGATLDGAGEIHTIDPQAVLAQARQIGNGGSEPEQARNVAMRLHAGSYVLGEVVEAGGRLRISARLYQSDSTEQTPVQATVDGPPGQLFQLVDALTLRLLKARGGDPGPPLVGLASVTTDSLGALKAYLEGERAYRSGQFDEAVEALKRAVGIDSTFALAQYRLATAAGWGGQPSLGREAVSRAVRYSGRVGVHERRLIEALATLYGGRRTDATRIYREIVGRYPNDFEAWFQLAELMFHGGSRLDGSWLDAREPLERVLSLEPYHLSALWYLSNIATRERNRGELDSLTRRIIQLDPGPLRVGLARMQRAVVFGDTAEQARFIADMRRAGDFPAQPAGGFIAFTTGDLRLGRRLWRLITEPSRSPGIRVLAYKTLAQIELMSGRWRAAQIELDSMALLDPAAALEHRALFSLWPLQQVSRGEFSALRDSLLRWKAAPEAGVQASLVEHLPARPYLRLYLLGLLESRLSEHSAALRYAAELERRAGSAFAPAFVADLSRSVRAEVSRAQGRPEEALETLQRASFWTRVDEEISGDSPFYAREYERLTRAELLYSLGRYSEALEQYRVLADNLFHSGAPAHLRMSEIYERQGERRKAADHYARFAELWKDSDAEVRALLKSPVASSR